MVQSPRPGGRTHPLVTGPSGIVLDLLLSRLSKRPRAALPVQPAAVAPPMAIPSGSNALVSGAPTLALDAVAQVPVETTPVDRKPATAFQVSDQGIAFLKDWEGFENKVYTDDGAGKATVGYGHLVRPGEDFSKGLTEAEAEALFRKDLEAHAGVVKAAVKTPLTQAQFDALVSMAYNIPAAFKSGTGLMRALEAGDHNQAATEMLKWDKARQDGRVITPPGLPPRRRSESRLFQTGVYDSRH